MRCRCSVSATSAWKGAHRCVRACREDLAAAIPAFGGYKKVATQLNWKRKIKRRRKPGFWENTDNLRYELDKLAEEEGFPPRTIPAKATLASLGRYDLTKAIERRGGFIAVRLASCPATHVVPIAYANSSLECGLNSAVARCAAHMCRLCRSWASLGTRCKPCGERASAASSLLAASRHHRHNRSLPERGHALCWQAPSPAAQLSCLQRPTC